MLTKIYLKVISDTVILICMSLISLGIFYQVSNLQSMKIAEEMVNLS